MMHSAVITGSCMRGGVRMNSIGNEPSEELQLIQSAKRGDVKAFSRLYAGIYTDLYKFALYTIRHRQDAEDAVSETVMTAWEKMKQLRKDESFRSWMFTILNNQCRKIQRERKKQYAADAYETEDSELEKRLCSEPDYAGQHDVRAAFGVLEEEERIIVAFSVFGGYQSDEIGRMTGYNPATVRSKKKRALGKMRKIIEPEV